MTIRTKVSSEGHANETTVHAGPAEELAALALEYAAGERGPLKGAGPQHFEAVAEHLRNGGVAESAGSVRFWRDAPDGTPYMGPSGYGPGTGPGVSTTPLLDEDPG